MSELKMRMRQGKKVSEMFDAEGLDALERAHVLGLAIGFSAMTAPTVAVREAFFDKVQKGIEQAYELRKALAAMGGMMGGKPKLTEPADD